MRRDSIHEGSLADSSFNDDDAEKFRRRKHTDSSRQSIASVARDTMTRVMTPQRGGDSTMTPRRVSGDGTPSRATSSGTPSSSRRTSGRLVAVQADFDQWMSLIRNNRINATNSWNFPLIDYFHDLSVLKDGNSINFQRASVTLDGCVKVYSSRVDSVSNETNKLLSGLVANKVLEDNEDDVAEGDQDEEGGEDAEAAPKPKKKRVRAAGTHIVAPEKLMMNIDELSNTIDPVFRKMCADFDEGGAKGLLLNSLVADKRGMMGFDGEEEQDITEEEEEHDLAAIYGKTKNLDTITEEEEEEEDDVEMATSPNIPPQDDYEDNDVSTTNVGSTHRTVDLALFAVQHFVDPIKLGELTVCPSLPLIEAAISDPEAGTEHLVKDIEAWSLGDVSNDVGPSPDAFGDDDDGFVGALERSFSEVLNEPQGADASVASAWGGDASNASTAFKSTLWDVTAYFDEQGPRNWAGPEHWKVQRIKSRNMAEPVAQDGSGVSEAAEEKKKRTKKQPVVIDFMSPIDADAKTLFTPGRALDLPKSKVSATNKYLLPVDMHFTARNLVRLFLKPDGRPAPAFLKLRAGENPPSTNIPSGEYGEEDQEANDQFWAELQKGAEEGAAQYDADFYAETGPDMDDNDLPDIQQEEEEDDAVPLLSQFSRRPDQLNFAKTARKVNVRLLKSNMWDALSSVADQHAAKPETAPLKLSEIVEETSTKYKASQLSDLTPSLYFINLLHLANEQSLSLQNTAGFRDLEITQKPQPREELIMTTPIRS